MPELDDNTRVVAVRTLHPADLVAVPTGPILLSWVAETDRPDAAQLGYQLRHRPAGADDFDEADPVSSGDTIDIAAPGGSLTSRERREVSVRIRTASGWTAWSAPLLLEGALGPDEITAQVIDISSDVAGPVPVLRTEFELAAAASRARLTITALGAYEVRINGRSADAGVLSPGWTSYQGRVLTDTLDVTELLVPGRNAIAVRVADAWYRGRMGFANRTAIYGDRIGALVQLEVTHDSGHPSVIVSDASWTGGFGELQSASIYDGSVVDRRQSVGDPSLVGFDDGDWSKAGVVPFDTSLLEARATSPVRVFEQRSMERSRWSDRVRLDAGQNIAGWVRLTVRGEAGTTVTVRHAEVLEPDGALHLAALRSAKATDTYILDGDGTIELEPPFTFHGFRYADVETDAEILDATAVAITSDLAERSTFSSSHPVLDRFHENVRWSQRDNFVSIPTDCPQRDERLGWTGDAQAFAPTASTLFDSQAFWTSWLRDLEIDQTDEGGVASVVPDIIRPSDMEMGGVTVDPMGRAGWADAATIVPMAVYESYGSREVLRRQLDSMRRWVEHLRRRAGDEVLLPHEPFQYGDWLDPDAPAARPWAAKVSSDYVANAFYVRSVRLLAQAELLVGEDESRADELRTLADRVAEMTWSTWGAEARTTQTGAALALEFDLAPAAEREAIGEELAGSVRREGGRIATGFLGTPLVLPALTKSGHIDEAYRMLLRRDAPSWLYQVDRGATTVWERWDAILPDGSIHAGDMDVSDGDGMISFNHYAYGAMIDWVYRNLAGLAPDLDDPGYRTVHVAPRPVSGIDRAAASIRTPYGLLSIEWRIDESADLVVDLVVPFGSSALLDLPVTPGSAVLLEGESAPRRLGHGEYRLTVTDPRIVVVAP